MQTFMISGTVFMSFLAGSLFGVLKGVALVVFAATAGASSCYFLSKLIGQPLISSLWPDKLVFFQDQVTKRRNRLLNYMMFLRVTPTLPNTFINFSSPIVGVLYRSCSLCNRQETQSNLYNACILEHLNEARSTWCCMLWSEGAPAQLIELHGKFELPHIV